MVSHTRVFQNVAVVPNPLPEPNGFVTQAYNMAWPQVLAFSAAILGILTVSLILRSLTKGG